MRSFGLIGFPLSHSFSKKFFTEKFQNESIADCEYELYPIEHINGLAPLIDADPNLTGLNVTIPHKVAVMPFLNDIDDAARHIGAVNCVAIKRVDGISILKGYNTDAYGFETSLVPFLKPHHRKALVLGDGGAAKAVRYVLEKLNIDFRIVVRNPVPDTLLYQDLNEEIIGSHHLIINTTPLGTYPNVEDAPDIPYEWITDQHLFYDLVYNPEETEFLRRARINGAATANGLEMLRLQAERSWEIWNS